MFGFALENWFFFAIGAAVSLALFWLGKRRGPKLSIMRNSLVVIDSPPALLKEDVSVLFRGVSVPRLSVSHITVWNSGDETIQKSMLVDADPFRLAAPGNGIVLDFKVQSDPQDGHRAIALEKLGDNQVKIAFDFLNPREGFVIRLLYTSGWHDPEPHGSLRGASLQVFEPWKWPNQVILLLLWPITMCALLVLLSLLLKPVGNIVGSTVAAAMWMAGGMIMGFLSLGALRRLVFPGIPRNLSDHKYPRLR